jgi:predicted DNA-binding ribbon-helix-helix protein
MTLSELVDEIDNKRQKGNLSSAIRLFVLNHFRSRARESLCVDQDLSGQRMQEAAL